MVGVVFLLASLLIQGDEGFQLDVKVVDQDGRPVPRAELVISSGSRGLRMREGPARLKTDREGRWLGRIDRWYIDTAREYTLVVNKPGHLSWNGSGPFSPDETRLVGVKAVLQKVTPLTEGATDTFEFSPAGRTVAIAAGSDITLWHLSARRPLQTLQGHKGEIRGLGFSADGSRLVSGGSDKLVRIWNPETGRVVSSFKGHLAGVDAVAMSPDGTMVASAAGEIIRIWSAKGGKVLQELNPDDKAIGRLRFLSDEVLLSAMGYNPAWPKGTIRMWDTIRGTEIRNITGDYGHQIFALSPDAGWMVTDFGITRLGLLDAETGTEIFEFMLEGWARSAAVSPDGRFLAVSTSKSLRLIEVLTGRTILRLPGARIPTEVHFAADSRSLAVVGPRGFVLLDLRPKTLAMRTDAEAFARMTTEQLLERVADPDPAIAHRAMWFLSQKGEDDVPLVVDLLRTNDGRIEALLEQLESGNAEAAGPLTALGSEAEPWLRMAHEAGPSDDLKKLIERIAEPVQASMGTIKRLRVIQLLEWLGAKKELQALAEKRSSRESAEAAASLGRLRRGP